MIEKQAFYRTLNQQAQALLEGEPDMIATPVSYTHLDVYKRQAPYHAKGEGLPG